jgi:hypothetical protein
MTIPNISKNVERDHWGNNGFNNPLVLPLPNQSADSFNQCLNADMNGKKNGRGKNKT